MALLHIKLFKVVPEPVTLIGILSLGGWLLS
ncbi:MAG: PEP-CTERM sorting domain-containing protein [Okeania sp. SIO2F4]|nr:PEP-CTERM sorting domain-containing protein [Okeania sp. SIO2F4]